MTRRLTKQQEEFVQHIIAGDGQREAYYKAYPNSRNWKPNNVDREASRLINKPHVQARYQELRDEYMEHVKEQIFYDRDQLLNDFMFLKEEAKKSIEDYGVRQANSNAYINSLKNIGEILNLYPDKKLDINATVSSDFEINIIDGDDDDEAKD